MKIITALCVVLPLSIFVNAASVKANAGTIPYPNTGVQNPVTYSFTAASTGDLSAYTYIKSNAGDTEELGLVVNGIASSITGLNNKTSAAGTKLDFGNVTKGDVLTFYIHDFNTEAYFYSDKNFNRDAANHVYSTQYAGGGNVPAGTYVGFEDTTASRADFNYADLEFVFTNTATAASDGSSTVVAATNVPEPASLMLLGSGLVGLVASRRSRRAQA